MLISLAFGMNSRIIEKEIIKLKLVFSTDCRHSCNLVGLDLGYGHITGKLNGYFISLSGY